MLCQAEWTAAVQAKLGEFMQRESKPAAPAPAAEATAVPAAEATAPPAAEDLSAPLPEATAAPAAETTPAPAADATAAPPAVEPSSATAPSDQEPSTSQDEEEAQATVKNLHSAIRWCAPSQLTSMPHSFPAASNVTRMHTQSTHRPALHVTCCSELASCDPQEAEHTCTP